jgi:hypothetical protein
LREERRLRVFENRVLRKAFGPKRDEVTGKWRKLHNEELNGLYCSLSVIRSIKLRRMRLAGHVVSMSERKGVCTVSAGKTAEKRAPGRTRSREEDNIKMELREVCCGGMDWIGLTQDR